MRSAPYRAPELWDVASSCHLDERVDVWSLGCLLYFAMHSVSPFERVCCHSGVLPCQRSATLACVTYLATALQY